MSIKIKNTLLTSLDKIKNDQFDEDTIRTLLITAREYLNYNGLIKELAHFIAHPQRNQGIFHRKVNTRYAKLKLAEEQMLKLGESVQLSDLKTEEDLSDFLLGGVNIDKIETRLFEVLYKDGLDDLSEEHLLQYTGFNKKLAEQFLRQSYTKEQGHYLLNVLKSEKLMTFYDSFPKTDGEGYVEIEETVRKGREAIRKTRENMNRLCSVLRGAIRFESVFSSEMISDDFHTNFSNVLKKFDLDLNYLNIIEDKLPEILLCLMALLHDASFEFYDKNVARVYLCTYLKSESRKGNDADLSAQDYLYSNGVLALYISYKFKNKTTHYPLFVSDLKIDSYIDYEDFSAVEVSALQTEILWFNAVRCGNRLKLTT
ncbi:hypothetical protein [Flavobacterium anhuiense]|uniref:hypothetical protein n=1 Tax=Flavobacterium anhuiense TaxID=459526 RepID=UPI003D980B3E